MNVTLPSTELKAYLAMARRFARRASGDAAWSFADGALTIEWTGVTSTMSGVGAGEGTVRVPSARMQGLAKMVFAEGDLTVRVHDGRLYLGSFSFEVDGGRAAPSAVPQLLPVSPKLRDVLLLPYRHDASAIEAAGLSDTVTQALLTRGKHVLQACAALGPLGISPHAVEAFVDNHLAAAARGRVAGREGEPAQPVGAGAPVGYMRMFGDPNAR